MGERHCKDEQSKDAVMIKKCATGKLRKRERRKMNRKITIRIKSK